MVNDCGEVSSPQTRCAVSGLSATPAQLPEEKTLETTDTDFQLSTVNPCARWNGLIKI